MQKTAIQFLTLAALFLGTWFGLSRIHWVSVLKVEEASAATEKKLGKLFADVFEKSQIDETKAVQPVEKLLRRICEKNGLNVDDIKLHLLRKDEINAFALPDRHLAVYSGLIEACKNEAELAGVLGHEIAHMEKNHVMKKLVNEVGLSLLVSMTTGDKGGAVVKDVVRRLSSTAYDRQLESEADQTSVDYLVNAHIDPEPFANFLYRLSEENGSTPGIMQWVSTHPESKERAEAIVKYIKTRTVKKEKVLTPEEWKTLKAILKEKEGE